MADCKCVKVLEQFEREHFDCMELFEQYLQQTKEDINQFQDDMLHHSKRSSLKSNDLIIEKVPAEESSSKDGNLSDAGNCTIEKSIDNGFSNNSTNTNDESLENCKCSEVVSEDKFVSNTAETELKKSEVIVEDGSANITETKLPILPRLKAPNAVYINGGVINTCEGLVYMISGIKTLGSCLCSTLNAGNLNPSTSTSDTFEKNKRFFIIDKWLCNKRWQRKLLKV